MTERMQTRYVSAADTAKIIRTQLKREFPGVKFSVRSSTFAGGSSVDVRWTDGPLEADVRPIVKQYQGGGFDGMIDLAYSISHWLRPDGRVIVHRSEGTTGSKGVVPAETGPDRPLTDDAELVQFSPHYIETQRTISPEFRSQLETLIELHSGQPFDRNTRYDFCFKGEIFREYGSQVVWQMAATISKWTN